MRKEHKRYILNLRGLDEKGHAIYECEGQLREYDDNVVFAISSGLSNFKSSIKSLDALVGLYDAKGIMDFYLFRPCEPLVYIRATLKLGKSMFPKDEEVFYEGSWGYINKEFRKTLPQICQVLRNRQTTPFCMERKFVILNEISQYDIMNYLNDTLEVENGNRIIMGLLRKEG